LNGDNDQNENDRDKNEHNTHRGLIIGLQVLIDRYTPHLITGLTPPEDLLNVPIEVLLHDILIIHVIEGAGVILIHKLIIGVDKECERLGFPVGHVRAHLGPWAVG